MPSVKWGSQVDKQLQKLPPQRRKVVESMIRDLRTEKLPYKSLTSPKGDKQFVAVRGQERIILIRQNHVIYLRRIGKRNEKTYNRVF